MASGELEDGLRSVAAGVLTPFDEDGRIVHEHLKENVEQLFDRGIRTYLACANISEYHSLSHGERIDVTESAVSALPDEACVLAGVGGSTKTATALIDEFERVGVDAMMIMPPLHTYAHERGLLTYYRKLASASAVGTVPYVRGFDPSAEFLAALTEIDNVVGIKYALEDVPKFAEAVSIGDDDVVWVDGMAEPYAPSLYAEGAEGFTAGVSNFRPEIGLALFEALEAGDWNRARELRNVTLPYQNFRGRSGQNNSLPGAISVPAVKYGLELAGFHGGFVREPLVELSEGERQTAEALYERLDADIERLLA